MNKVFTTLIVMVLTIGLIAQQVPRERVIVELATATWDMYSVGAALGVEDLVANGCDVAIIEYHSFDPFENTASIERLAYYGMTLYPTAKFDGVLEIIGGDPTISMYSSYLPLYNQRIAIPSDYEISIFGSNISGLDYDITVVIDLKSGTPPNNFTAHLALTESEIPFIWQNQTEVNYVCREMYPTPTGTPINFAGGNRVIISYTFALDPSWDAQHIELVAFVQNEIGKEILQGSMVQIQALPPYVASASYSCSDTMPCVTTSVDFYDNSYGAINSWNWSFEGGTPSTSTAQNPTVTYNSTGIFDVQLIVDDGSVTDTLLMEDYIEVITAPAQPNTPTGPTDLCGGGTSYEFTTSSVVNATSYVWTIDPANAGTISGTDTIGLLDVDPAYNGNIDVTVRADNQCGSGTWSAAFPTNVYPLPFAFWISDGGGYCEGTAGVEVSLDGSETGVDYELLLDGNPTANIVAGTGSAISFGFQTDEGIYTVEGFTSYCDNAMYGNAYIYPIEIPGQAGTPTGDEMACAGGENDYNTTGVTGADSYVWALAPEEAGTITGTTEDATVTWSETYTGTADITVQGINACGDGIVSDALTVTVNELPEPEISGAEFVYQGSTHNYSSPDHAGANYAWNVTGGTIAAGQGTHEISITWGAPGTGYINLTETSAENCEGIAEELLVNIEPLGVKESFLKEIILYPNPVSDMLNIQLYSQKDASITIQVRNQLGQVVIHTTEAILTGNNKTSVNTSDLRNGIYTIKLITVDGTAIQNKFVRMK
ncbi:MAG: T9SS type A sorting domain-containing protein [Bacteroidota bacterium]